MNKSISTLYIIARLQLNTSYSRNPETRTLKGNEKQFELEAGLLCQLTCIKSPKADCLIVITFLVFYFQNASDFSFLLKYVILHSQ